jgi:hypothetical protein
MGLRRQLRYATDRLIRYKPIRDGKKHSLPGPLVVSLASHAPRFPTLDLTLRCLMSQSVQPDVIVLWLAPEDWKLLPRRVRRLEGDKLVIRQYTYRNLDIRSFRKIIPALKQYPGAFIVTADDDVHYPRNWLQSLVTGYRSAFEVLCLRAHRIKCIDGDLLPYAQWEHNIPYEDAGPRIFPTGFGGILYPPGVLPPQTLDEEEFLRLCPEADDIWLYWMAAMAGRTFRRVGHPYVFKTWAGTQSVALYNSNVLEGGNDRQIASVLGTYGLPRNLIASLQADREEGCNSAMPEFRSHLPAARETNSLDDKFGAGCRI